MFINVGRLSRKHTAMLSVKVTREGDISNTFHPLTKHSQTGAKRHWISLKQFYDKLQDGHIEYDPETNQNNYSPLIEFYLKYFS